MVGVEPTFQALPDGAHPVAYILSANVNRRHLSKGQRAMATAMALLKISNASQAKVATTAGISQQYVGHAVVVRDHATELVEQVLAGTIALSDAYEKAKLRKRDATDADAQAHEAAARLKVLQAHAPRPG